MHTVVQVGNAAVQAKPARAYTSSGGPIFTIGARCRESMGFGTDLCVHTKGHGKGAVVHLFVVDGRARYPVLTVFYCAAESGRACLAMSVIAA